MSLSNLTESKIKHLLKSSFLSVFSIPITKALMHSKSWKVYNNEWMVIEFLWVTNIFVIYEIYDISPIHFKLYVVL